MPDRYYDTEIRDGREVRLTKDEAIEAIQNDDVKKMERVNPK